MKTTTRLLLALFVGTFLLAVHAHAEDDAPSTNAPTQHTKKMTTITTTQEGDEPVPTTNSAPPPPTSPNSGSVPTEDFLMTSTFGSKATSGTVGCKTEDKNKQIVKDLKSECKGWIKEQKAELGANKFQTGTCEEQCSDCGMSLQRCNVKGVVHYAK